MAVSYTLAVQSSWWRMVRMLFRPFRLETWLTLGFAAFLSEFLSHPSGGRGVWSSGHHEHGIPEPVRNVASFLLHPAWGLLLAAIVFMALLALLALMWVNCRGRFVFLDNVVRERAAIIEPWKRYARHGNSLFAFALSLTVVICAIGVTIALPVLIPLLRAVNTAGDWAALIPVFALWWVAIVVPFILLTMFTFMLLNQFVVPIMYRDDLGVLAAWRRLFTLFGVHKLEFAGYALFFLVLSVSLGMAVAIAGFATCCVGFVVLAIPYVGSVVLLPIEVTVRGMGPDFLAQYGSEWSIYAKIGMPAPAPTATPAPPSPTAPPGQP